MQIAQYRITQSNGNKSYQSSIRVWREGCIITHVKSNNGNLLRFIRKHFHCPERKEFIAQLLAADVPQSDVEMLLKNA